MAIVLAGLPAMARSGEILEVVPPDAVGVLSFRNIKAFNDRYTEIRRRFEKDAPGLPLGDLETTIGFTPGTIDLTKPITVVFTQPEQVSEFFESDGLGSTDAAFPVICFTPLRPDEFSKGSGATEPRARHGPWGKYYEFCRDGMVFVSNRRKPLRVMSRQSATGSLASRMDGETRDVLRKSDVFAHFSMSAWREKVSPTIALVGNLLRMGVVAENPETRAESQAILSWLVDGAVDAIGQMNYLTLGLELDRETLRIHHLHSFDPNGWMAGYLKSIGRSGEQPWVAIPDQPFLALGYVDWTCPGEKSLTNRMIEKLFDSAVMRDKFPKEETDRLLKAVRACSQDLHVNDFAFRNSTENLLPMEILSSYTTENPRMMLEVFQYNQEHTQEIWANFLSGNPGAGGKFLPRTQNGLDYRELSFAARGERTHLVDEIKKAYGPDARMQIAVAGEHHVVYALAQPPTGVSGMIDTVKTGHCIAKNPSVARVRALLPTDANVLLLIDVQRLTSAAERLLARQVMDGGQSGQPGPLLGWSCRVKGNELSCQLVLETDEFARWAERQVKAIKLYNAVTP